MAKRKNNQKKSLWPALFGLAGIGIFILIIALLTRGKDIALLNPKGFVADEQFRLLVVSSAIMIGFAALVLFFIYFFAWRYRETNPTAVFDTNAGRSKALFFTALAAPITIFVILVSLMLPATQKLEPQRPIESDAEQLTIRVVAMRWKWVFMYPEQGVAAVNFVQIPVDTPVRFELTADEAPMNSFWIPHLGGMLYSMTEHVNPLNLMAHTTGDYDGGAAEVNGRGFAGMRFTTRVSTRQEFDNWVSETAGSSNMLDETEYARLLIPSEKDQAVAYNSPSNQLLFDNLLKKYDGSHSHYSGTETTGSEGHH